MFPILWLWNKFLKNENLFLKKLENYFVVESTTIESLTYPYKLALSKWTCHKEQFCQYQFFFRKDCFRIRTCYEELIWSTDYPNVHIHTFWKCWSFIWRCFFPVSILKFSAATIRNSFNMNVSCFMRAVLLFLHVHLNCKEQITTI